jgi:hypothetical protein
MMMELDRDELCKLEIALDERILQLMKDGRFDLVDPYILLLIKVERQLGGGRVTDMQVYADRLANLI